MGSLHIGGSPFFVLFDTAEDTENVVERGKNNSL
jgi:hypothetical protein